MKTTKTIVTVLFAVILIFTACKKEQVPQPQKEEILITNLPGWEKEADLISKTEIILTDEEFEKIKAAIGEVEVKFTVLGNLQTLPYFTTQNEVVTTYFYKLDEKNLTIYRQKNKAELVLTPKPGDVQLIFYVLK